HQIRINILHADNCIDQDRKKHSQENDEFILRVTDPEPENAERDPCQRWNRTQDFHNWIDLIVDKTPPTHRDSERNGGRSNHECRGFALEAGSEMKEKLTRCDHTSSRTCNRCRRRHEDSHMRINAW